MFRFPLVAGALTKRACAISIQVLSGFSTT